MEALIKLKENQLKENQLKENQLKENQLKENQLKENQVNITPDPCRSIPKGVHELWTCPKIPNEKLINVKLGIVNAHEIAKKMNIIPFTTQQLYDFLFKPCPNWKFTIPQSEVINTTINCMFSLTNTINSHQLQLPPLSSYGLRFTKNNNVLKIVADCATNQPCLTFNQYLAGPIEQISYNAGCLNKVLNVLSNKVWINASKVSLTCQAYDEGPCIWMEKGEYYGVPTAPSLWIVNFALLYCLSPKLAASMPKYRAPIPYPVAKLLLANSNGVEWSKVKHFFGYK
jgi:hypothetical protein